MRALPIAVAVFSSVFFLSGCCWFLPAGDPPAGEIVPASGRRPLSAAEAESFLATSLIGYLLPNLPSGSVELDSDRVTGPSALRVLAEAAPVAGIRLEAGAPWVLQSRGDAASWSFALFRRGNRVPVWSETVELKR